MTDEHTIRLVVAGDGPPESAPSEEKWTRPEQVDEHALKDLAAKVFWRGAIVERKVADLGKSLAELKLDKLVPRLIEQAAATGANQVEVGLAVTAQGGIGLATVGAQASLTFVYPVDAGSPAV